MLPQIQLYCELIILVLLLIFIASYGSRWFDQF